jgi:hypothetical protein
MQRHESEPNQSEPSTSYKKAGETFIKVDVMDKDGMFSSISDSEISTRTVTIAERSCSQSVTAATEIISTPENIEDEEVSQNLIPFKRNSRSKCPQCEEILESASNYK